MRGEEELLSEEVREDMCLLAKVDLLPKPLKVVKLTHSQGSIRQEEARSTETTR